jgi:hypothetical protein
MSKSAVLCPLAVYASPQAQSQIKLICNLSMVALRELEIAAIESKSDVANMKSANTQQLVVYLQG